MDPLVEVTLIGVVVTLATGTGGYVSARMHAKETRAQRREDREADWARTDLLSERVAKQVDAVREQAEMAATLLRRNTEEVHKSTLEIMDQNTRIVDSVETIHDISVKTHGLVNSAMTEVKQDKLDGLKRELILMRRLGDFSKEEMGTHEAKIQALQIEINDRAAAADLIVKED